MVHLIVNPAAGNGRALASLAQAERFLEARALPITLYHTQGPGDATLITQGLPDDATVAAFGGDGTVHEVAAACIGNGRTLAVLPGGTGDDFALALGFAHKDLEPALETLLNGEVLLVDTGEVNGSPFVNSLGIGFDAEVAFEQRRQRHLLKGKWSYLWAVLRAARYLKNIPVEVTVDGKAFYDGPALITSLQNGPRTGGAFTFAPDASLTDGLLDLVIAANVGRRDLLRILPITMRGERVDDPKIKQTRGQHILLRWQTPRRAHTEGELMAAASLFDINIRPQSLRVLRPAEGQKVAG